MLSRLRAYFETGADRPVVSSDAGAVARLYRKYRTSVFLSVTLGYGFFYICRLSFSMAKKPMLDQGVLSADEMGQAGALMMLVYSLGRFTNGILADHANIRRFISWGLLGSAVMNLALGFHKSFLLFSILWAINGWFQSIGSAPCIVSLSQWFSRSERGTRYGLWSIAHGIGEGMSFVLTSLVVASLGWEWGFWGPGLICVVVGLILMRTLADRPQTVGLPSISEFRNDPEPVVMTAQKAGLREVAGNWQVWVLALSSAMMYMARYGINNWGSMYLQEVKNYSLVEAGSFLSAHPLLGLVGSAASGWVSDRFFESRRNVPCFIFGVLMTGGLVALALIPEGYYWADAIAIGVFGFAVGGLLVYLGGLMATDLVPQRSIGAAMGLVGLVSYLGAGGQDWLSGFLIQSSKDAGLDVTDQYQSTMIFWICASVLATLLPLLVARAGRGRNKPHP